MTPGLYVVRSTYTTLAGGQKTHVAFSLSKPYLEEVVLVKQLFLLECSYVSNGRRVSPKVLLPDGRVGWVWEGEIHPLFWVKVE